MLNVSTVSRGRTGRPLSRDELESLFYALWTVEAAGLPAYPEMLGGVYASYVDDVGDTISVPNLERLLLLYDEGVVARIFIIGSIGGHGSAHVELDYRCADLEADLVVRAADPGAAEQYVGEFKHYFPDYPLSKLDHHLRQRGYDFTRPTIVHSLPRVRDYYSRDTRLKHKKKVGSDEYPKFFELFVAEALRVDFSMTVGLNYKILAEGEGGDYDVLALNDAHELFYFECKSGGALKRQDFENFYRRHLFLRPAMSLIVFDETRAVVRERLSLMRQILTEDSKRRNHIMGPEKFQYPDFEPIPSAEREYAYHMNRNLFFCSGEKIKRAFAHCLRYYEGVVKQSSYLS